MHRGERAAAAGPRSARRPADLGAAARRAARRRRGVQAQARARARRRASAGIRRRARRRRARAAHAAARRPPASAARAARYETALWVLMAMTLGVLARRRPPTSRCCVAARASHVGARNRPSRAALGRRRGAGWPRQHRRRERPARGRRAQLAGAAVAWSAPPRGWRRLVSRGGPRTSVAPTLQASWPLQSRRLGPACAGALHGAGTVPRAAALQPAVAARAVTAATCARRLACPRPCGRRATKAAAGRASSRRPAAPRPGVTPSIAWPARPRA